MTFHSDKPIGMAVFGELLLTLAKHYPRREIQTATIGDVRSHLAEAAAIVEAWPVDAYSEGRDDDDCDDE